MMNEPFSPVVRQNSVTQAPIPPVNPYPPSNNNSAVPTLLRSFYSNDIFKTITFFLLICVILAISTVGWFNDKMTTDQILGIWSSVLFLWMPSPIQQGKKTKKIYLQNNNSIV